MDRFRRERFTFSQRHGRALYDVSTYNEDALNSTHARHLPARLRSLGWPVKTTFDAERYARDDGALIKNTRDTALRQSATLALVQRDVPHFAPSGIFLKYLRTGIKKKRIDRTE